MKRIISVISVVILLFHTCTSVMAGDLATNDNTDSDEMVLIHVQFKTPPEVALELKSQGKLPELDWEVRTDISFEEQALEGHAKFRQQLDELLKSLPESTVEKITITEEMHYVFNGVTMYVPNSVIELIAELPEVDHVEYAPEFEPDPMPPQPTINTIIDGAFGKGDFALVELTAVLQEGDKSVIIGDQTVYYNAQRDVFVGLVDKFYILSDNTLLDVVYSSSEPISFTYGDLSDDGKAGSADLLLMKLHFAGKKAIEGKNLIASDVDGDGELDVADLLEFKQKLQNNVEFSVLK